MRLCMCVNGKGKIEMYIQRQGRSGIEKGNGQGKMVKRFAVPSFPVSAHLCPIQGAHR